MADVSGALNNFADPSQSAFDPRLVEVSIVLPTGTINLGSGCEIYASGKKYASALMNECHVNIFNLSRDVRNNILSQTSPLKLGQNQTVMLTLDVGRESTGAFRFFEGNVVSANVSQPPDIGIALTSLTANFAAGVVSGVAQSATVPLSKIAKDIALRQGLDLYFQVKEDKMIDNYTHNGSISKEIGKLNVMGNVVAFVDNNTLVVIDSNTPIDTSPVIISASTGMVGVPQVTEYGVLVKMMINNAIKLGGPVTVKSDINPTANGDYFVTSIDFEIASREQPFWYVLGCQTTSRYMGTQ